MKAVRENNHERKFVISTFASNCALLELLEIEI